MTDSMSLNNIRLPCEKCVNRMKSRTLAVLLPAVAQLIHTAGFQKSLVKDIATCASNSRKEEVKAGGHG